MTTTAVVLELSEQAGRDYNQDRLLVLRDAESGDFLAVVSDGVGGTAKGEVAAECLITTAQQVWEQRADFNSVQQLLEALFVQGNAAIAAANAAGTNTAATLVALAAKGTEVMSVHAGDSRIYQCRSGQMVKVTQDHSLAYAKFKLGEITEDEIATHPGQSQLLNCMTGNADVHAEYGSWQVQDGDYFVLCSDGFWELFGNQQMAELVANENRHLVIANRLEDMLQDHPRHDNTTVVILGCGSGFARPHATPQSGASNVSRVAARKPGSKRLASVIVLVAVSAIAALLVWPMGVDRAPISQPTEPLEPIEPIEPIEQPKPDDVFEPTAPKQPEQPLELPKDEQAEQPTEPDQPEQADDNNQPAPRSEPSTQEERGDPENPTDQLNRKLNEAPRDTIPTDGSKPDIEVLKDHLRDGGVINEESELEQTDEIKDEQAHIVSVQLMVHDTPVYGALVRYLKTPSGLQLISGRLAYLETMPTQPNLDVDSCFAVYQQRQQSSGVQVSILADTSPKRYIDAGESSYFWALQVEQSTTPMVAEIHLRDSSCEVFRVLPLQVSG